MRLIDSTMRLCVPGLGVGRRWLREHLDELGVTVRLCEGCLDELARDAEAAVRLELSARPEQSYLTVLRGELVARAEFIRVWTATDTSVTTVGQGRESLVRIARKYALPRPWKLSDPAVAHDVRPRQSYWRWPLRDSNELDGVGSVSQRFDQEVVAIRGVNANPSRGLAAGEREGNVRARRTDAPDTPEQLREI
jgi:hypothetical protein